MVPLSLGPEAARAPPPYHERVWVPEELTPLDGIQVGASIPWTEAQRSRVGARPPCEHPATQQPRSVRATAPPGDNVDLERP